MWGDSLWKLSIWDLKDEREFEGNGGEGPARREEMVPRSGSVRGRSVCGAAGGPGAQSTRGGRGPLQSRPRPTCWDLCAPRPAV